MRTAAPLLLIVLIAAACDTAPVVAPTSVPPAPSPSNPPGGVIGVYAATFAASPSCALGLPSTARERTYTATFLPDGRITWTGATLNPPSGHQPISSGSLSGDTFSFSVDIDRDPQSDDFHGIWDDIGGGTFLNISGKGDGTAQDGKFTGLLNGVFAFYEPVPNPSILFKGDYCRAADHRFTFVKQ